MSQADDLAFYEQIKGDLLGKNLEGYFVLIKDAALVDVYPTYKAAYDDAVAKFGTAQVTIKEVKTEETPEII
jgi:hypothetical protein